ncbi:MAG TPA: PadR family transcriptional regulator [Acidimicrobiales bacterium]|jgi:PadR family transcriptional regulator, regulatory protein PadR|nr:PadR family transcriptional regulator [Acidimicrobiales bacterium]
MARKNGPEAEGLSRSYVRPLLLLLLAEGPSHGYELLEHIRQAGVRNADAGGLYRCLRAMEQSDLVSSWWEPSQSGPARRSYLLTDEGRVALGEAVGSLGEVHRLLGAVLERHELLGGTGPSNDRASVFAPSAVVR